MEDNNSIEIVYYPDEILMQKAQDVENIDGPLVQIAEHMVGLMHSAKGIGLAGPQVGIGRRFFVVQVEADLPRVFINPSIVATSHELTVYEEGCLSIPGLYADVKRPGEIQIQAWNEKAKPFTLEASGMLARVIQHELDHLNGVLFLDHLSERKREKLLKKYRRPESTPK